MTTLPGLEQYSVGPSPVTVRRKFLTKETSSRLFNALAKVPRDVLQTPPMYGGLPAKRQTITFYEGDEGAANAYMNKFGDTGIQAGPYSQAPTELIALRSKLQQMSKTGNRFSLCYINYYADEKTQIGLHRDREEENSPHALVMVTLGGGRLFSIWKAEIINPWKLAKAAAKKKGKQEPKLPAADWEEETEDGDLVVMPVGFHNKDGYYHAVLPQRQFAAARFSLTFRNPDLSASGPWAPEHTPRVWDCHAGKDYPAGAIYVGCCVRNRQGGVIRAGTIFGNGKNPLVSHRPWAAGKESDPPSKNATAFRTYAEQKMLDFAFRQEVEALRGKDLLCWCVQDGPKRAEFCHGRVWVELANGKERN